MDRQLTIEPQGDGFHLFFHNYAGPEEGHRISHLLGLREIEPPPGEIDPGILAPGQCFLWHPMDRHPGLHALVAKDALPAASQLVRDLHIHVVQGADLLPAADGDGTGTPASEPAPPDHAETGYVELFEKRHESVWHRGPRAVLGAFLLRAIPAAIVIFGLVVASRHFGDHHTEATIDAVFARARQPIVDAGFFGNLIDPDHSHLLRTKIVAVRYLNQNEMILADGNHVVIEGIGDLRPIFDRAQETSTPPVLDVDARDGRVWIQSISLGDARIAREATLLRRAQLGPSAAIPSRGSGMTEGQFREFESIAYDDEATLNEVEGKNVSLLGTLETEGDRQLLRMQDGSAVLLQEDRRRTKAARNFLDLFANRGVEIRADLVLDRVYPWKNRKDPDASRESTKLLGEGTLVSLSIQNYHLLARR